MSRPTAASLAATYAPHIRSKTILITGPSPTSVGGVFARAVAAHAPALVILAGRSPAKLRETAAAIAAAHPAVPTRLLRLDLSSLAAVRGAAAEVMAWEDVPCLDVVVANAGVMATPYQKTVDGLESQFAANHMAHWLFVNLVMDKILKAEAPRVVNVTSDGHRLGWIRFDDLGFQDGEAYNPWIAYGQSKTANMLTTTSLATKLGSRGLVSLSVHPGVIVTTSLGAHLAAASFDDLISLDRMLGHKEGRMDVRDIAITAEEGAASYVQAAFAPELKDHNGAYLYQTRLGDPLKDTIMSWATNAFDADRLWKLSEEISGQQFSY